MKEKRTFKTLFILLAVSLAIMPFVITFNNFFAAVVETTGFYQTIQNTLLPWEIRIVGVILEFFGIGVQVGGGTLYLAYGVRKEAVFIGWNCLGWQSFLLLIISLIVGFQGDFTFTSKLICTLIGFLGTFLLNILRIVVTTVLIFYLNKPFALVFHDYFAALVTVAWLGLFWWFSYRFVLEDK